MTSRQFADVYYTHGYVWQKGFEQGSWKPTERDKLPPLNPCQRGTVWFREWQDGYETRKKLERGE